MLQELSKLSPTQFATDQSRKETQDKHLESRTDLASGQVSRGGDELDPQRHGSLASVAELENGTAGYGAVVDEVEHAHLVEVEHHLELGRRDHLQAVEVVVHLRQRADEPRFLDLDFFEYVLYHLTHVADRLGDGALASADALIVVLVQVVEQLRLGGHHRRRAGVVGRTDGLSRRRSHSEGLESVVPGDVRRHARGGDGATIHDTRRRRLAPALAHIAFVLATRG